MSLVCLCDYSALYMFLAKSFVGSRSTRGYEFGRTYVVRPKGKHQATIVWLHGLGDNGSRYYNTISLALFL